MGAISIFHPQLAGKMEWKNKWHPTGHGCICMVSEIYESRRPESFSKRNDDVDTLTFFDSQHFEILELGNLFKVDHHHYFEIA